MSGRERGGQGGGRGRGGYEGGRGRGGHEGGRGRGGYEGGRGRGGHEGGHGRGGHEGGRGRGGYEGGRGRGGYEGGRGRGGYEGGRGRGGQEGGRGQGSYQGKRQWGERSFSQADSSQETTGRPLQSVWQRTGQTPHSQPHYDQSRSQTSQPRHEYDQATPGPSTSGYQPRDPQPPQSGAAGQRVRPKKAKYKDEPKSPVEELSSMYIHDTENQPEASQPKPLDTQKPPSDEPTPAGQTTQGQRTGKKSKGKGKPPPFKQTPASGGEETMVSQPSTSTSSSAEQKPVATAPAGRQTFEIQDIPRRNTQIIKHDSKYVERTITIEVNYLKIVFEDASLKIFHYDVEFKPNVPKYLLRPALRQMQQRYFANRHPAFDGKKNMYVAAPKLDLKGDMVRDTVTVHNHESVRDVNFDVTIKLVNQDLTLYSLSKYMKNGKTCDMPQEVIQGVDIALRSNLADRFTPAGRSFFSPPDREVVYLSTGLELWHGFYQSAIMTTDSYLNVDVANKGFPTYQLVTEFLHYELQIDDQVLRNKGIDKEAQNTLYRFLKGLKIDYALPGIQASKRTYKVNGLGISARLHRFTVSQEGQPDREMSVEQYFDKIKNYRLQYPELPLIHAGPPLRKIMLPAELCRISHGQAIMRKLDEKQTSNMVKNAATATHIRKQRIMDNIRRAGYANDPVLNEFGIRVNTNFERVQAHILRPPKIGYRAEGTANVVNGVWRQERQHFVNSPPLNKWAIISTEKYCDIHKLVENLIRQGEQMGIEVSQPFCDAITIGQPNQQKLETHLANLGKKGAQIVVVIMTPREHSLYSWIKRASEFTTGVLTQCIKSQVMKKMNAMTAGNLLLKMNAKINGTNHIIPANLTPTILKEPCMIIGADVTHPSPGVEGCPSIAAVVASHDTHGFKYNMMYRLQTRRTEMIEDLEEMIKAQIEFYRQTMGMKPAKLLYFRDGVSEGQFQQLLHTEKNAIKRACARVESGYDPQLTVMVVQKRHHTRFFPSERDGDKKNRNTPSGTLVDSTITHPTELDFYLVSHQSIQGTARPTKYHLLWDDNQLTAEQLQILTYYLCFMFTRCTRAVSYPAPTYYAHLAAFRARAWYEGLNTGSATDAENLRNMQNAIGRINNSIIQNAPMFFV